MRNKMQNRGFVAGIALILIIIGIILAIGWVMNIVEIFNCDFEKPIKAEVVRIIGVFIAPLGGVCGYLDIADGKPATAMTPATNQQPPPGNQ